MKKINIIKLLSLSISFLLIFQTVPVYAASLDTNSSQNISATSDNQDNQENQNSVSIENQDAEYRLNEPVLSNDIPLWPSGPLVSAESAIVMDADSGTILYSKNIHEKLYPASTTKILTALVAIENSTMNETVQFTADCLSGVDLSSSNMGMDPGQSLSMEECLYGILVHSANEVCNAVAEHIAGSIPAYVDMMNQKAKELGCTDSHFMNPNGLHDPNHYTSAYDLATIARSFFQNDTLTKISNTKYYLIEPSATQPDTIECYTHNAITKGQYSCEGYLGGKTGYTSNAHSTLVTCAKRGNMKLICVVMKEDTPSQFTDTLTLFDYGFQNFQKLNVSDYENKYTVDDSTFFKSNNDVFGYNDSIIYIHPQDFVILPNTLTFNDLSSSLQFTEDKTDQNHIADIEYTYNDIILGKAKVMIANQSSDTYEFEDNSTSSTIPTDTSDTSNKNESFPTSLFKNSNTIVFLNIYKILLFFALLLILALFFIHYISYKKNYHFSKNKNRFSKFSMPNIIHKPKRKHKKSKDYVLYKNKVHLKDSSRKIRHNKKRQS